GRIGRWRRRSPAWGTRIPSSPSASRPSARPSGPRSSTPTGYGDEVQAWIEAHLGPSYPWPGNVRELEQCVRNVLIRGEYRPPTARDGGPAEDLAAALRAGALTAEQLLARYCALVYAETRSYQETARRLGLDRRTVKSKVFQYGTEGR